MAVNPIKAERVVRTILGTLERASVVSRLVWLNPAGDFRGAKNDTITIRVPAYTEANTRDLRSGDPRTASNLFETKVDVSLDTDIYKRVPLTDENITLDIASFETEVVAPVARALVRGIETEVISLMTAASYQHSIDFGDFSAPYNTVNRARRHLNDSRVPMEDRALVVGSGIEELLLNDDNFVRADQAGDSMALREAQIGRVAGFNVFTVPGLDPDEGYAFHRTAYAMSLRAPAVPRGAPMGASMSWEGYALRTVWAIDPEEVVDNFNADVWTGTNTVPDYGTVDSDGFFAPDPEPDLDSDVPLFVRAVQLTNAGSS